MGSCAETVGLGCVVAAVGTDNAFAGIKTVWAGNPTKTSGAALLESMGVPKEQSEIVYALMTGQVGMLGTAKANQVVTTAIKLENGDVVNVVLNLEKDTLVAKNASKVGSSSSTTSNAGKGNPVAQADKVAAQAQKDLLNEINSFTSKSQANKNATMVGAYDPVTGKTAIGNSNANITAEALHPKTVEYIEKQLGLK